VRLDQPSTAVGNSNLQIAVDGTSVYWSEQQMGVYKNLIGAGNELQLLNSYYASAGIAVDASHVYYSTYAGSAGWSIYGMAKDGTGVYAIDGGSGTPVALAVDATYVYYVVGSQIYKAPK
jgi:hypothetical protein